MARQPDYTRPQYAGAGPTTGTSPTNIHGLQKSKRARERKVTHYYVTTERGNRGRRFYTAYATDREGDTVVLIRGDNLKSVARARRKAYPTAKRSSR